MTPALLIRDQQIPMVRRIFVVAPNLIFADKTNRKPAESAARSVRRCHEPCEIGRPPTYFGHLSRNCKRRRTRWRSEADSNSRFRCPTWGKLYRNSHFGTHFGPKNLGFSGLSLGFKSLLLRQRVFSFRDSLPLCLKNAHLAGIRRSRSTRELVSSGFRRFIGNGF